MCVIRVYACNELYYAQLRHTQCTHTQHARTRACARTHTYTTNDTTLSHTHIHTHHDHKHTFSLTHTHTMHRLTQRRPLQARRTANWPLCPLQQAMDLKTFVQVLVHRRGSHGSSSSAAQQNRARIRVIIKLLDRQTMGRS